MATSGLIVSAVLRRTGQAIFTLWLVTILIFSATSLLKGDAATQRLAGAGSREQVNSLRIQLGLNQPLPVRYWRWIEGVVQWDLGVSFVNGRAVSALIIDRGSYSLALGISASLLLIALASAAGLICGLRPGSVADRVISLITLCLVALPEFVTGTLLVMLFALSLHWLPALSLITPERSLWTQWPLFVLPVITLITVCLAQNIKLIRLSVIRAAHSPACECARFNGIAERQVVLHWILPAVVSQCVPTLARYITYLFGGALIAETLFGWPGLAAALLNATLSRDTPVVMGIAMTLCALTVLFNLLADCLTTLLNPAARRKGS